jgi:dimethylhistidine N-methyltransferase
MRSYGVAEPAGSGPVLNEERFLREVLAGLSAPKKTLPCKYLYDETGARLFEAICELEEYYLTRTELSILRKHIHEIAALLGPHANLVELGSGNCLKTRLLLDHLDQPASYSPVDVAYPQLVDCSTRLAHAYPGLAVEPVCADYTRQFTLPTPPADSLATTFFFPGSTIGNFEPEEAVQFLGRIARLCGPAGGLLIGVDLKKPPQMLKAAYNDAQGVTAKFNLNLLVRINRELKGRFDLRQFQHQAIYNESASRIEMHLVSCRQQIVDVDSHHFAFSKGESIVTEHSYKYSLDQFRRLAACAGFEVVRHWSDERHRFSVQYLVPCPAGTHDDGSQSRK